jgi:hypothetical protein
MMPYRLAENIKIYTTNFLFRETQALKKDPTPPIPEKNNII